MIYAVNKRTKTHHVIGVEEINTSTWPLKNYLIVEADDDGWIEWKGGECPLPEESLCQVILDSSSGKPSGNIKAGLWRWQKYSGLIAYRPILNAEEAEMKQGNKESHLVAGQEYEYSFTMFQHPVDVDIRDAVKFIGMDGSRAVVRTSRGTLVHTSDGCLRAVRSDRDRWIEAAMAVASCPDKAPLVRSYFESIYDAGLAKLPEQTK